MRSIAVAGITLVLCAACKPAATGLTDEQRFEIAATVDSLAAEWWAAWEAVDVDRGMSFVARDDETTWSGDDGILYTYPAIDEAWQAWGERMQGRQQIEFTDSRTLVLAPEVVSTVRRFTSVQTHAGGSVAPEFSAVETLIWVRRGGEWKVLVGHESVLQQSWRARLDYWAKSSP
jgi:ketosteroid isomerase-like protein